MSGCCLFAGGGLARPGWRASHSQRPPPPSLTEDGRGVRNRQWLDRKRKSNAGVRRATGESSERATRDIKVELDGGEWVELRLECGPGQRLVETRVELPLGLVMEEQDGAGIVVCEVGADSNSATAVPRVEEGDRLLVVSAVVKTMVFPATNVMLGGIGRPALKRVLLQTEKRSFDSCMDAVRSNSEFDGVATMILMRELREAREGEAAAPDSAPSKDVFDPRIFD